MKITGITLMLLVLPVVTMAIETSSPDQTPGSDFHLPECPGTPNCVSSLAKDPAKKVEPFILKGDSTRSMALLAGIIKSSSRAAVISSSSDSIIAEYRSLLGFVDDVLFVLSPDGEVIHVRSASRSGTWDLGVNRRRVEKIRKRYLESGY